MALDLTDVAIARLKLHTIGLSYRKSGSHAREVLGSGVLVTIEGRRGILTCGHVAELFEKVSDVQLGFFNSDAQNKFPLRADLNQIIQSSHSFEEAETVIDLAFTLLTPELATAVDAKSGVFLNADKNRKKMEEFAGTRKQFFDVIFGLVEEFSGEPEVYGKNIVSNLRAVLYSGRIVPRENGLLYFEPRDRDNLPNSFGGMSGSGVWRIYYDESKEGDDAFVAAMLCGIVSWQRKDEKQIACQGWDRIDQALIRKFARLFHSRNWQGATMLSSSLPPRLCPLAREIPVEEGPKRQS